MKPSGKPVEVEGGEYYLTKSCLESGELHEFEGKTNRQILDHLSKTYGVHFDGKTMRSGDFIVCKPAVKDSAKRNITGTVKEILNTMQAEKGCNVSDDCHYCPKEGVMQKGGNLNENELPLNGKQGKCNMETTEKTDGIIHIVPGNTIKGKNRTYKIISVGDEISVCPDEPFNESETITRPLEYFKEKFQQGTFEIEGCEKGWAVCELNLIERNQTISATARKDQEHLNNRKKIERITKAAKINNKMAEGGEIADEYKTVQSMYYSKEDLGQEFEQDGVKYTLIEKRDRERRSNDRGWHPAKWIYSYEYKSKKRKPVTTFKVATAIQRAFDGKKDYFSPSGSVYVTLPQYNNYRIRISDHYVMDRDPMRPSSREDLNFVHRSFDEDDIPAIIKDIKESLVEEGHLTDQKADDIATAVAGNKGNKYKKEIIEKYGTKMAKGGPLCPEGTQIQSLIFEKGRFTKAKAKTWAKKHHFQYGKTDEQENTYRIRQELPRKFRKDSFRTIPITKGIQATVACPK